jgi:hypothetical protein
MPEEISIKEYGDGSYLYIKKFCKDSEGKIISYTTETFSICQAYAKICALEDRVKELEARLDKHCGDFQTHNILIGAKL